MDAGPQASRVREIPPGLVAARLAELARRAGDDGVVWIAAGEEGMDAVAAALRALAPELTVLAFPPWDCLPYDRAPPSREVMGRRMATLRALQAGGGSRLVLTTPGAVLQRTPPREAVETVCTLRTGEELRLEDLRRFLLRTGHYIDERVDEPGEAAIRGQVVDVFPAGGARPFRVFHDEARITGISPYDPATQRSNGDVGELVIGPASEVVSGDDAVRPDAAAGMTVDRSPGIEHSMARHYGNLSTVLDALPKARLYAEAGVEDARQAILTHVSDGYEARREQPRDGEGEAVPLPLAAMSMTDEEWTRLVAPRLAALDTAKGGPVPRFAAGGRSGPAFADFVEERLDRGDRVVLAGAPRDFARMARPLKRRTGRTPEPVADWNAATKAAKGALLSLEADLDRGFVAPDGRTVLIAAADLLGGRAERPGQTADAGVGQLFELEFQRGDVVVHLDHGLGILDGLETIQADGAETEVVRLRYARDESLLVPVVEAGRLWRYGSDAEAVHLDRLESPAWEKRRAELARALEETARAMLDLAEARAKAKAPALQPPARELDRFTARFPFTPTRGQQAAFGAALADLARDRPMDRLVSGDVGFGKTEVALRAAAAAALSGHQVAVIAPTTVLARQHFEVFRRRFDGFEVTIGHLSRVASEMQARAVREGLASGETRIVVGTHAVFSDSTRFRDLALVIIDEEQHFGARDKARIRALGEAHVLTMTATPIPRTLQSALAGLQEVSVIATAPVRRQPVRTTVSAWDGPAVQAALRREHARGGQSFVVCPQIADLDPMHERLARLAPELKLVTAHGRMPPAEVDQTMVGFANGRGDVLLATNIIGAGLDVPRANTMLVWRADRFGLAQLHQLRGRVGRSRLRGTAWLLTDAEDEIAPATRERLETLAALDRLGAGFAVAARDLDLRGAGDLLGEEQAGHVKLIGVSLYQHLLGRALARLRGEERADVQPEIRIGLDARIPTDYVPEPEIRLGLYARIARAGPDEAAGGIAEEIADRFGPPPREVTALMARARLERLCRRTGVARIDGGPDGIALSFAAGWADRPAVARAVRRARALEWRGDRLVLPRERKTPAKRLRAAMRVVERLTG
ncbi:MAG TPA: DEAD/DEAH box helicase [Paracoccaceae bacterium]|nr:DEAD/DEAH box helicase [Paracoccaceae bacterium]